MPTRRFYHLFGPITGYSMKTGRVRLASSDLEIERCHAVMAELRPRVSAGQFVARVHRQQQQGYMLAYLELDERVVAVAGYRLLDTLHLGRHMYVDDLVTTQPDRSRGWGAELFAWLVERARADRCVALSLDSGVQRYAAHRFYLRYGMRIAAHHFVIDL